MSPNVMLAVVETKDWIMVVAVLMAPLVALQVQKLIEAWKEKRLRKLGVYLTLMTTRHATLSFEHVRALNMIDLEFRGSSESEANVRTAWKTYLDHLASAPKEDDKPASAVWNQKSTELLTQLLQVMGQCVGYAFDSVHVQKGIYAPKGHFDDEIEQRATRRLLLGLLLDDRPLNVHAALVPADDQAAAEGKKLLKILSGRACRQTTTPRRDRAFKRYWKTCR